MFLQFKCVFEINVGLYRCDLHHIMVTYEDCYTLRKDVNILFRFAWFSPICWQSHLMLLMVPLYILPIWKILGA